MNGALMPSTSVLYRVLEHKLKSSISTAQCGVVETVKTIANKTTNEPLK